MTHGLSAYKNHGCRCDVCRKANAINHAAWRAGKSPAGAREHGTAATYKNYGCRCDACRDAGTNARRAERAWVRPADAKEHGTLSTYTNYNCRCAPCREAARDYGRNYRRSRMAGSRNPDQVKNRDLYSSRAT